MSFSSATGISTTLAAYAAFDERTGGRLHVEPAPQYRGEFQRDRDRIIHSTAFRRLEYKTQVFVNHEGDMFRTRLTHSIEVAQIGRTLARVLSLNEDLTEAICLAHDLGHTPFGHAGQTALNQCMRDFGGFEHNLQSIRVVDLLEEKYATFRGLNLTFETREGILKHCSRTHAQQMGALGKRFLEKTFPGLEAQIANLADEIAYNHHDVDDGLRAGLISLEQLCELKFFAQGLTHVRQQWPGISAKQTSHEVIRHMINRQVVDVLDESRRRLQAQAPESIDEVRSAGQLLISFSSKVQAEHQALKKFLHKNLYQHERVQQMTSRAGHVVGQLFAAYSEDDSLLPDELQQELIQVESDRERMIADYIAGMTDRFAIIEYERIYGTLKQEIHRVDKLR